MTKATYGSPTAKAAELTETKVSWVKAPAATGGVATLTIAGSTDVAGYVYCGVTKSPTRRFRILNTTAEANKTVVAKTEPKVPYATNL